MKSFTKLVARISIAAMVFTSAGSVAVPAYADADSSESSKSVIVCNSASAKLQEDAVAEENTVPSNLSKDENGNSNGKADENSSDGGEGSDSGDSGDIGDGGDGSDGGGDGGDSNEDGGEIEDPEPAVLELGAIKSNGKWRYYIKSKDENGNPVAVPKKGTGWIKINGVKTYYLKNGYLVTGWQSIKSKNTTRKYYFSKSTSTTPKMYRGYHVISGKPYYFKKKSEAADDGRMMTGTIKNSKGSLRFYANSNGVLKTGWHAYKSEAYYFYKTTNAKTGSKIGYRAKNYKVNRNITIGKSGKISGTRGKALYYGIKALDKSGWSLYSAYTYSYKLRYANRPYRPGTVATGAVYGFTNHNGNCYVMNCCFHVMADLMGYEVRQIKSSVGMWKAPHSWLEIKQDGKWWVYDANFRNETGRNGFKIYYGKSGTWRYNRSSNYLPKY